jgi:hypothetical protein
MINEIEIGGQGARIAVSVSQMDDRSRGDPHRIAAFVGGSCS